MDKTELIATLRSCASTQVDAQKTIRKKIEAVAGTKTPLSNKAAEEIIKEIYKEAKALTLPFGETVECIMRQQGITKIYRGREIIDVPRAVELTQLNPGIFRTNMYKVDCVVDMALVVTMAIGFKLTPVLTDRLLQSAGLAFRFDNPEHLAYMFLLEYCQDLSVKECNEILDSLGIRKTRQLGSHSRGKDGEFEGYRERSENV